MTDEERMALRYGPYRPPAVSRGDTLHCELRGDVEVADFTEAPIPWPRALKRGVRHNGSADAPLILCGDLIEAVRQESAQSVAHWWGVAQTRVTAWRKALGVERMNQGSSELNRQWREEIVTPEQIERAVAAAARPEARRKSAASRVRNRQAQESQSSFWTSERIALLGTKPDAQLAQDLGISVTRVGVARRRLGIAPFRSDIAAQRHALCVVVDGQKVWARRLELHLSNQEAARRAGIGRDTLSEIERGAAADCGVSSRMFPHTLEKLARALECEPNSLLGDASVLRDNPPSHTTEQM